MRISRNLFCPLGIFVVGIAPVEILLLFLSTVLIRLRSFLVRSSILIILLCFLITSNFVVYDFVLKILSLLFTILVGVVVVIITVIVVSSVRSLVRRPRLPIVATFWPAICEVL